MKEKKTFRKRVGKWEERIQEKKTRGQEDDLLTPCTVNSVRQSQKSGRHGDVYNPDDSLTYTNTPRYCAEHENLWQV